MKASVRWRTGGIITCSKRCVKRRGDWGGDLFFRRLGREFRKRLIRGSHGNMMNLVLLRLIRMRMLLVFASGANVLNIVCGGVFSGLSVRLNVTCIYSSLCGGHVSLNRSGGFCGTDILDIRHLLRDDLFDYGGLGLGNGLGFRGKSLMFTHNLPINLLINGIVKFPVLNVDFGCRWLVGSLVEGVGHVFIIVLPIVDELIVRIGLLIGSSIEIILHFLLWHMRLLLRIVVLHHIISCSGGTWLLIVLEHTLVIGELHATADVLVKIDIDVVVVGRVGR